MILTVELPHACRPHCWFAFDEADFIRKTRLARPCIDAVIFSAGTPRTRLAADGLMPDSPGLAGTHTDLVAAAATHGWDTMLYRADFLLAPGLYQVDEVSEFVAHVAAVAHSLKTCRVYADEEQAMDALHADPLYADEKGFLAHMALREQLIALEVISDDL